MGANIGTTVTGWLVSVSSGQKCSSPANIAPVAVMIGVIVMLTGKRRSTKDISSIIVGFGILFIGITTMSDAVEPLQESEGILQSVCNTWTQSVPWNSGRSACYSSDSEFICIGGDFTESCGSRTGSV